MNCIQFDINRSLPNKSLTQFLLICSSIVGVLKLIHRLRIRTGLIVRANKSLQYLYLESEGLLKLLNDNSEIDIDSFYSSADKNLRAFRAFYFEVEKKNFFDNNATKEVCDRILQNFYQLEAQSRMISLANYPSIPEDKELLKMASSFSMSSVR